MEILKNSEYELLIEDITGEGEGVGKINGYALFVKDTMPGDRIIAKVIKVKKNYGYGRLVTILQPSQNRCDAPCPNARACGGCTLMNMKYSAQLEYKRRKIAGNLERIGGFKGIEIPPVTGMDNPYRYRNKAQFPFGEKNGEIITGFYAGRTHDIIPCEDCLLGISDNSIILGAIKKYMSDNKVSAYDEKSGSGVIRHVLIRAGFKTSEVMICIIANASRLPKEDLLVSALLALKLSADLHITSIVLNTNMQNTNVIMGKECRVLYGNLYISDYIGENIYRISPLSFYQVNPVQTEKLYELTLEMAGLSGNETVWDLYCGIGTISLFLARKAGKVFGVEVIPQAIEDAKFNAQRNGLNNVEFMTGKAEEIFPEQKRLRGSEVYADVIVVDPPRKGCDEKLLETMLEMGPKRIVYVSCDSATLARDLRYLCEGGYEIMRVQGVDQFCHTGHVECVCLLSKVK